MLQEEVAKYKRVAELAATKSAGYGVLLLGAIRQRGQAPGRLIISGDILKSVEPGEIGHMTIKKTTSGGTILTAPKER
jgi:hypothetical protein